MTLKFKLMNEKLISDWADDMDLCRQPEFSKRDQVCLLLRSIMQHAENEFNQWVKKKFDIKIEYGGIEYLPDEIMKYMDEADLEIILAKLLAFYIYLDESYRKNFVNEEGADFVASVVDLVKAHFEVFGGQNIDSVLKNFYEDKNLNFRVLDLLREPAIAVSEKFLVL